MTDAEKPNVPERAIDGVESYLLEHATDATVTTGEIADAVDLQSDHDTNPPVREVVQYLVLSGRLAVDGSGNGYTVATTEDQRADAIQSLRDHIGTLNRRVQGLKDARLAHECDGGEPEPLDEGDCAKCGGTIAGDAWEWYSYDLCRECYDNKPASSDRFHEWIEQGAVADA